MAPSAARVMPTGRKQCAKCGSADLLRYPRDVEGTRLTKASFPMGFLGNAGRPNLADPILVCQSCGHNQAP